MAAKKEVTLDVLEKAKKALANLPEKAPLKKPLEAALEELKPLIEGLVEKGYSRGEVVEHLVKLGIPAKQYHLKAMLAKTRAEKTE